MKIYKPENEAEKAAGLLESLRTNDIFSKLIDEFNGHPLPSEQGLSARLIRSFSIKDYAADKVAQIFLLNLKNNGFVDANNVLNAAGEVSQKKNPPANNGNGTNSNNNTPPPPTPPGFIEIPVPLSSGKRAYIKIPEDYKPEDCERIAKFVEALK